MSTHKNNSRVVYAHSNLRNISYCSYEDAEEKEEGRFNNCLVSMVFSALCLEAYMNYIGEANIKNWELISRSRIKDKLESIAKELNVEIDFEKRPFQTFLEIFSYRNKLAHAKTEYMKSDNIEFDNENNPKDLLTTWEKETTLKKAKLFLDETRNIIETLHRATGLGGDPLAIMSGCNRIY